MYLYLRAASQRPLQQVAVLSHPRGEVSVPFVHRGDAAAELGSVGVSLRQHALSQLDEEVDLLLGVLRGRVSV